jgi:hypothetical protein
MQTNATNHINAKATPKLMNPKAKSIGYFSKHSGIRIPKAITHSRIRNTSCINFLRLGSFSRRIKESRIFFGFVTVNVKAKGYY